jgi:hypothetical protein
VRMVGVINAEGVGWCGLGGEVGGFLLGGAHGRSRYAAVLADVVWAIRIGGGGCRL